MYTLEGVSSVANFIIAYGKSPIFLSVVRSLFPTAIFLTFILQGCIKRNQSTQF